MYIVGACATMELNGRLPRRSGDSDVRSIHSFAVGSQSSCAMREVTIAMHEDMELGKAEFRIPHWQA